MNIIFEIFFIFLTEIFTKIEIFSKTSVNLKYQNFHRNCKFKFLIIIFFWSVILDNNIDKLVI